MDDKKHEFLYPEMRIKVTFVPYNYSCTPLIKNFKTTSIKGLPL